MQGDARCSAISPFPESARFGVLGLNRMNADPAAAGSRPPAERFAPEPLALAVPPVAGRTHAFLVCHPRSPLARLLLEFYIIHFQGGKRLAVSRLPAVMRLGLVLHHGDLPPPAVPQDC